MTTVAAASHSPSSGSSSFLQSSAATSITSSYRHHHVSSDGKDEAGEGQAARGPTTTTTTTTPSAPHPSYYYYSKFQHSDSFTESICNDDAALPSSCPHCFHPISQRPCRNRDDQQHQHYRSHHFSSSSSPPPPPPSSAKSIVLKSCTWEQLQELQTLRHSLLAKQMEKLRELAKIRQENVKLREEKRQLKQKLAHFMTKHSKPNQLVSINNPPSHHPSAVVTQHQQQQEQSLPPLPQTSSTTSEALLHRPRSEQWATAHSSSTSRIRSRRRNIYDNSNASSCSCVFHFGDDDTEIQGDEINNNSNICCSELDRLKQRVLELSEANKLLKNNLRLSHLPPPSLKEVPTVAVHTYLTHSVSWKLYDVQQKLRTLSYSSEKQPSLLASPTLALNTPGNVDSVEFSVLLSQYTRENKTINVFMRYSRNPCN